MKCPRCGELYIENKNREELPEETSKPSVPPGYDVQNSEFESSPQPEKFLKGPVPVPDREETPVSSSKREELPRNFSYEIGQLDQKVQGLNQDLELLKREKENLGVDIAGVVQAKLRGRFFVWTVLMIWTVVFTFVSGYLLFQIHTGSSAFLNKAVTEKFSESSVRSTLENVAKGEASGIIQSQLEPSVLEFHKDVAVFEGYLDETRKKFDEKYEALAKELLVIDARRNMMQSAERALLGSRKAYEELQGYRDGSEYIELKTIAAEQLKKVEAFMKVTNRIGDVSVNYLSEEGQGLIDEAIPTQGLIEVLRSSPHWKFRAKAAELLGNRVEAGVPEVLLEVAELDPFLDVVKEALKSFSKVTGYDGEGIFDVGSAQSWWQEHRPSGQRQDMAS
ncbi:MAG: HEAT repeat domain-containing protein [Candidatus Omnitrophica bacterium]|nr:HEAT repeat domain-containing protein [Candidatus Omnitrophota bacterium]